MQLETVLLNHGPDWVAPRPRLVFSAFEDEEETLVTTLKEALIKSIHHLELQQNAG